MLGTAKQLSAVGLRIFILSLSLCCVCVSGAAFAQSGPSNLNVSGALYLPSGLPVTNASVNFRLEIWDKNSTCMLYSEQHLNEDLSASKGGFALAVGRGTSAVNYLESSAAFTTKIFENTGVVAGGWANCAAGTNLVSGDERTVRVHYDLGGGFIAMSPDVPIASSAYAMIADTLQGRRPTDFVQLRDDVTYDLNQGNVENVFSSTNYARLQQLLSPSAAIGFSGQRLTNIADPSSAQDATTKTYSDTRLAGQTIDLVDVAAGFGGGKVLTWDQTAAKWVASVPTIAGTAGGDLSGSYPNPVVANLAIGTSKLADNAVTSAKISTTGLAPNQLVITDNVSGATLKYATCANNEILKFVTGTGWQCSTVASLSAVLSVNGKSGVVVLNGADLGLGTASMRDVGVAATNVPELDAGGKLLAGVLPDFAGDLSGTYAAAFVDGLQGRAVASTAPNANEVLRWNGTLMQWEPSALVDNVGITSLTGDVSASGTGAVAATITNGVITTPKMFATPGANRLVATDATTGATLVPFVCNLNESLQWTATGWACANPSTAFLGNNVIVDGGNGRGAAISIGTTDNYALNFKTNNINRVTVLTNGNVGIGTTSPSQPLTVSGTTLSSNFQSGFGNAVGVSFGSGANGIFIPAAGILGLSTAGTERMRLDSSGNVGIGTTAPTRLLQVAGAMKITPTANPGTPTAGDIFIDAAAANSLKYHNGSDWVSLAVGGTGDFLATGSIAMTGQFRGIAGSASTPGIAFAGDTDNGIFAPGADNFAITTAGVEKMRILANGNVGIGTTGPTSMLHLKNTTAQTALYLEGSSATTGLYLGNGAYVVPTGIAGIRSSAGLILNAGNSNSIYLNRDVSGANVYFQNAGTDLMTVLSTGNVGIGTTVPGRLLSVNGSINVAPSTLPGSPAAGDIAIDSSASNSLKYHNGTSWISLAVGGTGDFRADGSVPMTGALQHIAGTALAPGLTFVGDSNTGIFAPAADTLAFGTTGLERMRISANGNVGFGTTNPSGNVTIRSPDAPNGNGLFRIEDDAGGYLTLTDGTGATNQFTPLFEGHPQGSLRATTLSSALTVVQDAGTEPALILNSELSGNAPVAVRPILAVRNYNSIKMLIDATGRVGIGTTSPGRLLSVAGPINVAPTTLPGAPVAGDIALDSGAANSLKYHNGTNWVSLAVGGTGDFLANGSVAMTGQLRHFAGTATAPGLSFAGDTDNGIFAPNADELSLVTTGAERMRVLANGNVGIGVTNPSTTLSVTGTTTLRKDIVSNYAAAGAMAVPPNSSSLLLTNNNGSNANGAFTQTNLSNGSGLLQYGYHGFVSAPGAANYSPAFVVGRSTALAAYAETFRVDSNGFVGIGTTNPNRLLEVTGPIRLTPATLPVSPLAGDIAIDSAASNSLKYHNGAAWVTVGAGGATQWTTAGSNIYYNIGNVGIGTTNPAFPLEVIGTIRSSSSGLFQGNVHTGIGSVSNPSHSFLTSPLTGMFLPALDNLAIGTSGVERIRVLANGNVGIGTTNPGASLEVNGAMRIGQAIQNTSFNGNQLLLLNNQIDTYGVQLAAGDSMNLLIDTNNDGTGDFNFRKGNGNPAAASPLVTIKNSGFVGIGTSTPTTPLAVRSAAANNGVLSITNSAGNEIFSVSEASGNYGFVNIRNSGGLTNARINSSGDSWFNANSIGNVGIGTSAPSRLLSVNGILNLTPGVLPASPLAGDITLDSGAGNSLKYHNGSSWISLAVGGTGDFRADGSVVMTGALRHLAGTAASPGLTFAGDTDNGIFAPAADNLAFGTSASEKMRILANGNVGIGTTAPASLLDVQGTAFMTTANTRQINLFNGATQTGSLTYSNLNLYNYNNGTAVQPKIELRTGTSSGPVIAGDGLGEIGFAGNYNAFTAAVGAKVSAVVDGTVTTSSLPTRLAFSTTPSGSVTALERLRIDSSGNVGVGTTAPTRLLSVNGAMRLTPSTTPGTPAAGDIFVDSAASNTLNYFNGSSWVAVASGGGTGDFKADGTVAMTGSIRGTNGVPGAPSYSFATDTNLGMYRAAFNTLGFSTAGSMKMQLDGSGNLYVAGNVGIGTSTLTQKFNVAGDGAFTGGLKIGNSGSFAQSLVSDGDLLLRFDDDNTSASNEFKIIHNGGTELMRVDSNGRMGIGMSAPARLLHVGGPIRVAPGILPASPAGGDLAFDSGAGNALKFYDGTSWITVGAGGGSGDFLANGTVPMTGQFWSTSGSSSAPGMSFAGDTDNGIFAPVADNIAMTTSGSEKLRVLANGNVGIGTTSPTNLLHISSSSSSLATIENNLNSDTYQTALTLTRSRADGAAPSGTTSLSSGIEFKLQPFSGALPVASRISSGWVSGQPNNTSARDSVMTFETMVNNVLLPRLHIDSSGWVGIGTTSPVLSNSAASDSNILGIAGRNNTGSSFGALRLGNTRTTAATLDTLGEIDFISTGNTGPNYKNVAQISSSLEGTSGVGGFGGFLAFSTKTNSSTMTETMRLNGAGNLGIGTTNPTRKLQVEGAMRLTPSTTPGSPAAGDIFVDSAASNTLNYFNGSSWVAIVSSGGGGDFLANGTVPMTGQLRASTGAVAAPGISFSGDTDNGIYAPAADNLGLATAGVDRIRILPSGFVGIGNTNPTGPLEVTGVVRASIYRLNQNGSSGSPNFMDAVGSSGMFMPGGSVVGISTGGVERLRVDSAGFVGIGTSTPGFPLDVSGIARAGRFVANGAVNTPGSPTLTFNSDSDSGLYLISNDTVGFSTGSTERMRLDASGNLGIGVSAAAKLDVAGNVKLGTTGTSFSSMGICTIPSATHVANTQNNFTCAGVPASTNVAVNCSPSAAVNGYITARASGTANIITLSLGQAGTFVLTCMWMVP